MIKDGELRGRDRPVLDVDSEIAAIERADVARERAGHGDAHELQGDDGKHTRRDAEHGQQAALPPARQCARRIRPIQG